MGALGADGEVGGTVPRPGSCRSELARGRRLCVCSCFLSKLDQERFDPAFGRLESLLFVSPKRSNQEKGDPTVAPSSLRDAGALRYSPLIGRRELAMMQPHAWLINVGRGRQVVTDDLVAALRDGVIGGAGLDVTEPEPLPTGHPLWSLPNCVVTPHTGTSDEMTVRLLAARVADNVARWIRGEPLVGPVSRAAGY